MNTLTRRRLIAATPMIPIGLALADCAALGTAAGTALAPAAASAIEAIGQYFVNNVLSAIQGAGASISSSTLGTITQIVNSIGQAAAGISTATTQTQGQSTLQTIEGYVNNLAPVVAPFLSLIPGAGPILTIAFAALPAIEGLVNLGSSLLTPLVSQIAAAPVPSPAPAAGRRLGAAAPVRVSPNQALALVLAATGH